MPWLCAKRPFKIPDDAFTIKYDGTTQCMVGDGATDRYVFEASIMKVLCPTLKVVDMVVMDNLLVHKTINIRLLI